MRTKFLSCAVLGLLSMASMAAGAKRREVEHPLVTPPWPGEQMPLPLTVQTPADLEFKQMAEHQYLLFNLLAGGKLAYDRGDMATAADKWEKLLSVPGVPAEMDRVIRPLAIEARSRSGKSPSSELALTPPAPSPESRPEPPPAPVVPYKPKSTTFSVQGIVTGGGNLGPGGSVVWLMSRGSATPHPRPASGKTIIQKGKRFIPHVLAVPTGTVVHFRNDDEVFHNVFSLSPNNKFDLGLNRSGISRDEVFNAPGPVNVLCNIHAAMSAYVYVVDTPYYAQADRQGNFTIKGVPPGSYVLKAWHETSSDAVETPLNVRDDVTNVSVAVSSDRPPPAFVPDKSGKPRQPQLGN